MHELLQATIRLKMETDAYVGKRTLFDVVEADGGTTNRRQHSDILVIWESYEEG